ncbi:MAG: extracellular solute-binding protein [Chloroflexota bacterium]|nr:MAG: extracellular solute-binding protein [Chloroflexota bacterium]
MKHQKRLLAFFSLILIFSLLAACAPKATPTTAPVAPAPTEEAAPVKVEPTEPPATEPPAAPPPTEEPKVEPVTISVWTNRIGEQAKLLEEIARKFEQENPDIKIEFSAPGQDYENLMRIKMAANDMPDVFSTHGWAKVRYGDFLMDLRDEPWAGQIDAAIKPAVVDDDGKVYVLPMDQEKTGPVFNADILEQYGVEVPMTWNDLLAACETIKTQSDGAVTCIHMGGADSWPVGQYYDFFSTALAISPEPSDAQALLDGTYDWTKYTVLSANLLALQEAGYLNVDVLTAKYTDSAQAFADGKAAFGFYGAFLCEEALKINPDMNCGLMPIPALIEGDTPTFAGGEMTTWGVWKDSQHADAAKRLIAYYALPENIAAVANSNRIPAGLTGVTVDAGYLTQYYTEYADLRTYTYFDRIYLPNGMWDVLCRNGQDVLAGGVTPEQATDNISKEYERLRASQ